jgi:opacity protein-like surface antigen
MPRYARVAMFCLVSTLGFGAALQAQTGSASSAPDSRLYVEVNAGPTLGHKSDAFVGAEGGYRFATDLDLFVEVGHMGNVGTTKLESDATTIADFIGGTVSSSALKANYFDVGVRYHLSMVPAAHPYVLAGIGIAHVSTEVAFAINGTVVDPAQVGVQLGGDLSGSTTKTLIVAGGGINVPFMKRFFADLGYRYGHIAAKTSSVESDAAVHTQRVILGVGINF